jgi:hypothetical protein
VKDSVYPSGTLPHSSDKESERYISINTGLRKKLRAVGMREVCKTAETLLAKATVSLDCDFSFLSKIVLAGIRKSIAIRVLFEMM